MSKPNPTKRMVIMLVSVGALFALVFGYGALRGYMIGQFLKGFAHQVQTVATLTAVETPWQPQLQSVGTVTAINGAALSAEVSGIIDTIGFESGTDVQKGQVLATLRQNNDPAVLAQLQATAKLDQINYARDQKQFTASAVSQAQLDSDRETLAAAQAQVAAQQALMAEKVIRAPFAGRLGIRKVDIGQYISPGTEIVTLEQLDPLYVDFYLPQRALSEVQVGQAVNLSIDAYPGQNFPATVSAIGAQVDQDTRSIAVRATVPNGKLLLRPGMFASLNVATGAPASYVTLPQTAITYSSYGDTVFIVRQGKDATGKPAQVAEQVFVTLGDTRGDQVAVLTGVQPGDVVVSAGQVKLRNGVTVAINNSVQPPNSATPNPPNE
jgi:membrane fusion protein, multidrug efflux system